MASDSCRTFPPTAATWVLGSADHYQHQHLALLAFFQTGLNFLLRLQKQEIPCALWWNLGLSISKTNCCFYKTSWRDGLFYGFCLWEFFYVNCCEISKVCLSFRLHACTFFHLPTNMFESPLRVWPPTTQATSQIPGVLFPVQNSRVDHCQVYGNFGEPSLSLVLPSIPL